MLTATISDKLLYVATISDKLLYVATISDVSVIEMPGILLLETGWPLILEGGERILVENN